MYCTNLFKREIMDADDVDFDAFPGPQGGIVDLGNVVITRVGEIVAIELRGVKETRVVTEKAGNDGVTGLRDLRSEREPATDADLRHTAIVLPRTGHGPGSSGRHGDRPGSGGIHSRSDQGEHRTRDRGEQPPSETPSKGPAEMIAVSMPAEYWAALLHTTEYNAFGPTALGAAASSALGVIEKSLNAQSPDWRTWWQEHQKRQK